MTLDEIESAVAADREGKWTAQTVIAKIEEGRDGMTDDTQGAALVERFWPRPDMDVAADGPFVRYSDYATLQEMVSRLERERDVLETMRPVWADASIVGCLDTALAGLWKALGAKDQTDAMEKLRALKAAADHIAALQDTVKRLEGELEETQAAVRANENKLCAYMEQDEEVRDRARKDAEHLLRPYLTTGAVFGFTPDHKWNANGTPFAVLDAVQAVFIRAEAAERRLAEQGQAQDEAVACERCAGNGEIVTDWDRYRHPHEGDVGDEAVADCPNCNGIGTVPAAPPSPEPDAELENDLAEIIRLTDQYRNWNFEVGGSLTKIAALAARHRKQGGE